MDSIFEKLKKFDCPKIGLDLSNYHNMIIFEAINEQLSEILYDRMSSFQKSTIVNNPQLCIDSMISILDKFNGYHGIDFKNNYNYIIFNAISGKFDDLHQFKYENVNILRQLFLNSNKIDSPEFKNQTELVVFLDQFIKENIDYFNNNQSKLRLVHKYIENDIISEKFLNCWLACDIRNMHPNIENLPNFDINRLQIFRDIFQEYLKFDKDELSQEFDNDSNGSEFSDYESSIDSDSESDSDSED